MLHKFSVENFKNFEKKLELDFTAGKYAFNESSVKNNIIKNAVVYGINGSGKSNLIYAIMDITTHLTDFQKREDHYILLKNLNSSSKYAEFQYTFKFDNFDLVYKYKKASMNEIFDETVIINGEIVIYEDFKKNKRYVTLKGAESLNVEKRDPKLSFVKYIFTNTKLEPDDKYNKVFLKFKEFVYGMLYFSSGTSEGNFYQGFKSGTDNIAATIIDKNNLNKLEEFLNSLDINYKLEAGEDLEGRKTINVKFKNRSVNIFSVASHGTRVIIVFYYWLVLLKNVKFLVIDEFDAYYHNLVAIKLLERVRESSVQSIFTTHNTSIMSNDFLRPDNYFVLHNNKVSDLSKLTNKELRIAHNLEKIYNAGAFYNE